MTTISTRGAPTRTTVTTDALELVTLHVDADLDVEAATVADAAAVSVPHTVEIPPTLKLCSGCDRTLSRASFGSKAAAKDGLQPHCKSCRATVRRATYAANGDAEQAKRRARRAAARAEREAAKREAAEAAKRAARYAREDARDDARELRYAEVLEHGKKCPSCGEHQSAGAFYEREDSPDGFQSWCIGCLYSAASQRQREQADEINAQRRARRAAEADDRPGPTRWW